VITTISHIAMALKTTRTGLYIFLSAFPRIRETLLMTAQINSITPSRYHLKLHWMTDTNVKMTNVPNAPMRIQSKENQKFNSHRRIYRIYHIYACFCHRVEFQMVPAVCGAAYTSSK
jgi:hypothetical protein